MKANDFDLPGEISFSLDTGITSFRGSRMVIVEANALGLLRQSLLAELGWEKSRELLLRFGYQNGYADFLKMQAENSFESETELLAAGPVMHTWEGVVKAIPGALDFDRRAKHFHFTGVWKNSYEAEQHLKYNPPARESVCWTLSGYATGWSTAFFGSPLLAVEPQCVGRGDEHCAWDIRPPIEWGDEFAPLKRAFSHFWGEPVAGPRSGK